jgi:ABC-type bacteriocin/lantibiotic exporter with double-glycine peptidase domain
VGIVIVLSAVLLGRTFFQHVFRSRTESDVLEGVVTNLIEGDVLRANVLADDDARAELAQGVFQTTQALAVELPVLVADVIAAALLSLVTIAREPPQVAGTALGVTILAGLTLLLSRRAMAGALSAAWEAQRAAHEGLVNAIEGRLDIVAAGRSGAFLAQIRGRTRAWAAAGSHVAWEALIAHRLPLLGIAAAVAVGIELVGSRGHFAVGVTPAEVAVLAGMTPAFSGLAQRTVTLDRAVRWMAVVAGALADGEKRSNGAQPAPRLPAPVAFDSVSFAYGGAQAPALQDVSFTWSRGILAITGANGSGKSTCLRLLLALAPPQSGTVSVGGVSLREIDADDWRAQIAFLPQRPYIPPRSDVRAAIRFLAPNTSDEAMRRALERVGLLSLLERSAADPLSVSVDTLSVGSRQRVALARLLCQRGSLVLLDEPDANLDRAGIELVASLVREIAAEALVAFVAHSGELIDAADRVLVLDGGRVLRDEDLTRRAIGEPMGASAR